MKKILTLIGLCLTFLILLGYFLGEYSEGMEGVEILFEFLWVMFPVSIIIYGRKKSWPLKIRIFSEGVSASLLFLFLSWQTTQEKPLKKRELSRRVSV